MLEWVFCDNRTILLLHVCNSLVMAINQKDWQLDQISEANHNSQNNDGLVSVKFFVFLTWMLFFTFNSIWVKEDLLLSSKLWQDFTWASCVSLFWHTFVSETFPHSLLFKPTEIGGGGGGGGGGGDKFSRISGLKPL